jgi:hypothetical protein
VVDRIEHKKLLRTLSYNQETGWMTWLVDQKRSKAGTRAGFNGGPGYRQVRIDGILYYEHILIWFWMTGKWPVSLVDHDDTDKKNNAWKNLRLATHSQNSGNAHKKKTARTSRFKGVNWSSDRSKWSAFIKVGGKSIYLGSFEVEEDAYAAYASAARDRFGEFARVG